MKDVGYDIRNLKYLSIFQKLSHIFRIVVTASFPLRLVCSKIVMLLLNQHILKLQSNILF